MVWNKMSSALPPLPTDFKELKYNPGMSVRVLIWLESHETPRFGRYHAKYNFWAVEGCTGFDNNNEIKFWMEIQNPNK